MYSFSKQLPALAGVPAPVGLSAAPRAKKSQHYFPIGEGAMRPTDFIRLAVFILALITPAFAQTDPDARGGAAEAEALTRLGLEYAKSGQYSKAVEALKQAIRLDPEAAEGHYLLGATYNNMGRHDEAVEAFEEAVRLRPSWGEAYGGLVLCNHNSWSEVQGSRLSVSGPKALQT